MNKRDEDKLILQYYRINDLLLVIEETCMDNGFPFIEIVDYIKEAIKISYDAGYNEGEDHGFESYRGYSSYDMGEDDGYSWGYGEGGEYE